MKCLLFLLCVVYSGTEPRMTIVYEWKQLNFDFDLDLTIKAARTNWIQNNTFPLDAEFSPQDPKKRMFMTTPKFLPGVPATLSTVERGYFGNVLKPYPSWEAHSNRDCDKIISTCRIKITEYGHLWVIDSGVVDVLKSFNLVCPPKLLVFNLKTDQEIWRYEFPRKDYEDNVSLLGTIEVHGKYGKEYAYVADITGNAIVVVDKARGKSWKVKNQYTFYEPDAIQFKVDGQEFELKDGVVSVTSSYDTLYFHSLSGRKEYWVPLEVINNENNFINNDNSTRGFKMAPAERSGQSGPEALACGRRVMLFSNIPENSLYCWKTDKEHVPENLHRVFRNAETYKFASGLKVITDTDGTEYLLALTSPFGNIANGNVNVNKVNYRILKAPVMYLLKNTPCIH